MVEVPGIMHDVTAYALGIAGKVHCAVLINRGTSDVRVSLAGLGLAHRLSAMRLLAPTSESKTDVTFAGASVDASGKWAPAHTEHILNSDVLVPKMSAVVLRG